MTRLKHWGAVLWPVGVMLLLASVVTRVLAGETWFGQFNVLLGMACLALYLGTHVRELGRVASSRGTFFTLTTVVTSLLLVLGLVALNVLAVNRPRSWDLTKNKIFTLSPDTQKTLQGLTEPVQVTAFFQSGEKGTEAWEELFRRYHAISDKFTHETVNPLKDPVRVKALHLTEGGPRVIVSYKGVDQRVSQATEEELTNALVKVTHSTEKKAYFLTGHGEGDLAARDGAALSRLASRMGNEGLKAEPIALAMMTDVPKDASLLVVAGPQKKLTGAEVEVIRRYLKDGGRVLLALEPMTDTGLEPVLQEFGIEIDPGMIVDPSSTRPGAGEDLVFLPLANEYPPHPITTGLKTLTVYPSAASLTVRALPLIKANPLLLSTAAAWVEPHPEARPVQLTPGVKRGPLVMGVTASRDSSKQDADTKRSDEARLVVIGDHDFLTNGVLPNLGDEDLALNTLNWLASQADRLVIRPRSRDASRVYLSAAQLSGVRFFATELPLVLLALGLGVTFHRRAK